MSDFAQPLIVGAGPVGLSAALFLARQGLVPRVVERRREPSRHSKALAVNPRTLEILEPTGLTRLMLERGLPIRGVRFYRRGRPLAGFSLDGIHPDYPFMLALSQATTERLLASALEAAGGRVVRRVELLSRVVNGASWPWLFLRTCIVPVALRIPFMQARMMPMVTGLDHLLPDF